MNVLPRIYLCLSLATSTLARAQTVSPTPSSRPSPVAIVEHSPEELIAMDVINNYTLAYNLNNAAKVASLYSDDLQYQPVKGDLIEGKADLQARLDAYFQQHKGVTIDIGIDYVKQLTPDVITERGRTSVSLPGGASENTSFNLVLVKKSNQWLIAQVNEENATLADTSEPSLAALDWLLGTWKEEMADTTVLTKVSRAAGSKFLTRTYTVTTKNAAPFSGTEIIGWDAHAKSIHSWFFDQDGGFGEGSWSHEGKAWLVKTKSTLPDGRSATANHTWRIEGPDKLTWASSARTVESAPLPDIEPVHLKREK